MPRTFIKNSLALICQRLKKHKVLVPKAPLVVVFLDAPAARQINLEFRKRDYATDILSFANQEGLGELLICPQVIAKQAKDHKHSFNRELQYMLLHGLLHLLGFDHEKSQTQARRMFKLQDEIFAALD